ncbi:MAG: tetratricopeptide repeat protein [Algicola sp.]|nr:tetratricopeptide repeat protein [Algicola sp.]
MKSLKNSFLFFYCILCAFMLSVSELVYAQDVDSLTYYRNLALRPNNNTDLANTYAFFKQRSDQSIKSKDTLNVIYNLRFIAIIQFELGLLKDSETTAVTALQFIDGLKISNDVVDEHRLGINNHLGRVYTELKDYDSALKYFNKALELQQDPERLNSILNNIGLIYYKQANYQKALEAFTKVHHTNLAINNKVKIARSLNNIGMTMSKLKLNSAIDSLTKALEIRKSIDYEKGIFDSYLKFVEYYRDKGNLNNANRFAIKAYQLSKEQKSIPLEVEALSVLMQLNSNSDVQRYTKLMDSINEANLSVQNNYAAKKYALEKQERIAKENELKLKTVQLDNEKQKGLKLSYLFFGILILISAIFMAFYMRARHKKEKLQGVYDTESRISKKIHDEVANDVFQIMTKIEHENKIETKVIDELQHLYYRTRDISKEHVALKEDYPFGNQLAELIENFQDSQTNIIVKGLSLIDWDSYSEIQRTTIYKVLQELLINMKKHSQASIVALIFQKEKKRLHINYKDNGVGSSLKIGSGLQNTENRIHAIGGTITFDTELNRGFKVIISI